MVWNSTGKYIFSGAYTKYTYFIVSVKTVKNFFTDVVNIIIYCMYNDFINVVCRINSIFHFPDIFLICDVVPVQLILNRNSLNIHE
jgi:phosphate starvation-inducible membrane PsiE